MKRTTVFISILTLCIVYSIGMPLAFAGSAMPVKVAYAKKNACGKKYYLARKGSQQRQTGFYGSFYGKADRILSFPKIRNRRNGYRKGRKSRLIRKNYFGAGFGMVINRQYN